MTHIINVLPFPFSKAIHLGWWLSVLRVFIDLLAKNYVAIQFEIIGAQFRLCYRAGITPWHTFVNYD